MGQWTKEEIVKHSDAEGWASLMLKKTLRESLGDERDDPEVQAEADRQRCLSNPIWANYPGGQCPMCYGQADRLCP